MPNRPGATRPSSPPAARLIDVVIISDDMQSRASAARSTSEGCGPPCAELKALPYRWTWPQALAPELARLPARDRASDHVLESGAEKECDGSQQHDISALAEVPHRKHDHANSE